MLLTMNVPASPKIAATYTDSVLKAKTIPPIPAPKAAIPFATERT